MTGEFIRNDSYIIFTDGDGYATRLNQHQLGVAFLCRRNIGACAIAEAAA